MQRRNVRSVYPFILGLMLAALCTATPLSAAPADKFAARPVAAQPSQDDGSEHSYVIGAQNLIQIKIFGEAGTNQIYRVDESGFITHALAGRLKIANLTVVEAEKMMEEKLAGDYIINPHVTIFVLEHSHFSVLGEVRKPGSYEILGRVSIIEAISMAGGFTPVASQGNVKIIRKSQGKEAAMTVDTTKVTDRGDLSANVSIEADDVVVIGKSFF